MSELQAILGLWAFGVGTAMLASGDDMITRLLGIIGIFVGAMVVVASVGVLT